MKYMKTMLLGAVLITGTTTIAAAQVMVPVQVGWGYHDDDDRQAFKEGYKQGQWDARHNRRFDPDRNRYRERDDRQAYRAGYERGFREIGGFRGDDRDRDRDHDSWGRGGNGMNAARQNGNQDGMNDGIKDGRSRHSNRPTEGDNFKHADHGYIPTYGNKEYYKQAYREAYQKAYEQGYNSAYRR
jgi:hypothetical protein